MYFDKIFAYRDTRIAKMKTIELIEGIKLM